ncbi:MAG: glycosyltransferase [Ruminococcaceae bacterium]|nr:glycosyltransferase [Oscillospiraceae bacterium]
MKKILIVNNNLKVGGVQKSLYNLLWALNDQYEITLLLFQKKGVFLNDLPKGVRVKECRSLFRFFGTSQAECKGLDKLKRGVLAFLGRRFGRKCALRFISPSQKTLPEHYDVAVAYLHNGNPHHFYGGVQDFVLKKVKADKKIAFLHCDYRMSDANHPINNRVIEQFDAIAACSDGCRAAFCEVMPHLKEKCVTVRNFHRYDKIQQLSECDPVRYAEGNHVLMVTRLAHEKGVERAIEAAAELKKRGVEMKLHIVGSGAMKQMLTELTEQRGLTDRIIFHGEQDNPYRFMKNASLLLLTSFYEAAPMVIEEAAFLGLPVLTTKTTSSEDMVVQRGIGWQCENSQESLNEALFEILTSPEALCQMRKQMRVSADHDIAATQTEKLFR